MDKIEPSCACPSMCRKSVEFALWIFQLVSCDYFHNYTVHLFRTLVKEQSFIRRIIIMGSPGRHVSLFDICLRRLPWTYRAKANDRADWPAGKATITRGLRLGRFEVLRNLIYNLLAQSPGHHTKDRLDELGVERTNALRPYLKRRERDIVRQNSIGSQR